MKARSFCCSCSFAHGILLTIAAVTSLVATTALATVSVTFPPAPVTVCAPSAATFTVAATANPGPLLIQWQLSTDGGLTWNQAPDGGTNLSTTITPTTPSETGWQLMVILKDRTDNSEFDLAPVLLTVRTPATASAGPAQTICANATTTGLGGTVGGGATGGTWTSATGGLFAPNATTLGATYSPSATDISAGAVTLTLSSTDQQDPCPAATAQVVVTINPAATVSTAGSQTICSWSSATAPLGGEVGGGATGGTWTSSGTGTFTPNATTLNAAYIPSMADITAEGATLTLITTGQQSPCGAAMAFVTVYINPATWASSGGDQAICSNSATAPLGGEVGGGATGGTWTSSGTGTFTPSATMLNATYTPSEADISAGAVTLTLTTTGQIAPCDARMAYVVVTINDALLAIAREPSGVTNCAGTTAMFYVGAYGPYGPRPLSYRWRSNGTNLIDGGRISGATTSQLTISSLQLSDAGNYSVVVTNACGSSTNSLVAALVVTPGLEFINDDYHLIYFTPDRSQLAPADTNVAGRGLYTGYSGTIALLAGSPTFIAALYGGTSSNSLSLQTTSTIDNWHREGQVVAANAALAGLPAGTPAYFQIQIYDSRDANATASMNAGHYYGTSQIFTAVPNAVSPYPIYQTTPPVYSTWADGTFPLVDYPGTYGAIMVQAGTNALLSGVGPQITAQPASQTNAVGTTATFTVTATGTQPLSYQWRFNGTNLISGGRIGGAATNQLTISSLQLSNAGSYSVMVTNAHGSTNSAAATLTVTCPAITLSPFTLPAGTAGVVYNQSLSSTNGAGPCGFTNTAGSLPAGLSLSGGGVLSGTPSASGTNTFTVTATDTNGCTGSQAYTLAISGLPRPGIVGISLSGTNLVVNGNNGVSGRTYYVLVSTNLAFPRNQWVPVATNLLSASGSFTLTATNVVSPAAPGRFYILQVQ